MNGGTVLGMAGFILGTFVTIRGIASIYLGTLSWGLAFVFGGLATILLGEMLIRRKEASIASDA